MTQLVTLTETINGSKILDCLDSKTFARNAAACSILIFNKRHNGYNSQRLALCGLRMHLRHNKYVGREFAIMKLDQRWFIYWRIQRV